MLTLNLQNGIMIQILWRLVTEHRTAPQRRLFFHVTTCGGFRWLRNFAKLLLPFKKHVFLLTSFGVVLLYLFLARKLLHRVHLLLCDVELQLFFRHFQDFYFVVQLLFHLIKSSFNQGGKLRSIIDFSLDFQRGLNLC